LARLLPIAVVAPVTNPHFRPVKVWMAQGSPVVEGLPAYGFGRRFVRTISTPDLLQGDTTQRTTPCAFGELKHGSKM
jgi:hypothetical protein